VVVTTVHDLQLVRGNIPMTAHDVPVDVIVTPTHTYRPRRAPRRLGQIRWNELDAAQLAAMPALSKLRR
jgi:5-formyltetrahydrofolate cyclo-ligase